LRPEFHEAYVEADVDVTAVLEFPQSSQWYPSDVPSAWERSRRFDELGSIPLQCFPELRYAPVELLHRVSLGEERQPWDVVTTLATLDGPLGLLSVKNDTTPSVPP
jgi:hypothetical protein